MSCTDGDCTLTVAEAAIIAAVTTVAIIPAVAEAATVAAVATVLLN